MWNTPEYKLKREKAKKQRAGKDGVAKGTHTTGSLSHVMTAKKLEKEKGEAVTPGELFLHMHTRKHDGMNFVNDRFEEFQARFQNLSQPNQTPGTVLEALNHMEAFYKACGGITSGGKVFGLGSAPFEYYGDRLPLRRPSSSRVDEAFTSIDDAGKNHTSDYTREA
ncbi:hypothetical protein M5689_000486 [Euphorbia peplus]|nr:hypothetical protein M5689_000486 [Euphorbia peplus]